MRNLEKSGESYQFRMIMESALITKKKTDEVLETLQTISEFESKLHYENIDTINELQKNNISKAAAKKTNEVESNSQELAFTYLPYWDTNLGNPKSQDTDTKKALEWFELTVMEAHNVCKKIDCYSFRDFILYFRTNGRLFDKNEVLDNDPR